MTNSKNEKNIHGGTGSNQHTVQSGKNFHSAESKQKTGERLADEYSVLTNTRLDYQNQQDDNNKCFPSSREKRFD